MRISSGGRKNMLFSTQVFRRTRSTGNRNNSSCIDKQRKQTIHSNSTSRFRNRNIQQITNNDSNGTFNSGQLTGFPARSADETLKSSLLSVASVYINVARLVVTSHGIISHVQDISSPNRDIGKMIAFSGIFDFSPTWSPMSGVQA
ncbi:hypothetical protein AVEN_6305-1 [Araneus ventricosus]|uniref:Uncharacterized protein n=1 Tax=Araneus ventricosus TaxID=182803 RepID=A0A4Y2K400_ARAVE|nr:hypothetical protein AVEN_6305-1 [Araneus ventricosus]